MANKLMREGVTANLKKNPHLRQFLINTGDKN